MSADDELPDPPKLERLNAWYDRKDRSPRGDRPRVSVWWPGDPPTARLQTRGHGCNQPVTLPEGPITAYSPRMPLMSGHEE